MLLRYIPNILTFLRLFLIVPFLICFYGKHYEDTFYIFVFAGCTDGIDGWLARYCHWQSFVGSFVDPLADKLLVASSFIALATIGKLPWWLVGLVFLRDLTLSIGVVMWYRFVQRHLVFAPTLLSKCNTACQLLLVVVCLFELAFFPLPIYAFRSLMLLTAVMTAITYFDYVWTWSKKACKIHQFMS